MTEHTCPDCGITYTGPNAEDCAAVCEAVDRRIRSQDFHRSQRDPV